MNLVLLLVFGRLRCQRSFESFCNFTPYSIIMEGIFSIIEQIKYKKVDYSIEQNKYKKMYLYARS